MKLKISEIRAMVYEAVAQARGKGKAPKEFVGQPPEDPRGSDGYDEMPAHDLSRPPPGGGRMKRQGATSSSPVLTSEQKIQRVVAEAVRAALSGRRR